MIASASLRRGQPTNEQSDTGAISIMAIVVFTLLLFATTSVAMLSYDLLSLESQRRRHLMYSNARLVQQMERRDWERADPGSRGSPLHDGPIEIALLPFSLQSLEREQGCVHFIHLEAPQALSNKVCTSLDLTTETVFFGHLSATLLLLGEGSGNVHIFMGACSIGELQVRDYSGKLICLGGITIDSLIVENAHFELISLAAGVELRWGQGALRAFGPRGVVSDAALRIEALKHPFEHVHPWRLRSP